MEVNLSFIGNDPWYRSKAICWLEEKYGPASEGYWRLMGLTHIYFREPKHATLFIMKWT
jgi:hypothetical protein